jgi:hypothetical protein
MSKTIQQIEARLERLEKEVAEVKVALVQKPGLPWYRQILGTSRGTRLTRRSFAWAGSSAPASAKANEPCPSFWTPIP